MKPRPQTTQDHELRCPRDGQPMEKVPAGDVTYDRCASCSGLWFDASELRRVSGDRELESIATRSVPVSRPSGFGCPRCWGDCEQTRVGRVAADTCTSCRGVWLDAAELPAAQAEVEALRATLSSLAPWQRLLLASRPGRAPSAAGER